MTGNASYQHQHQQLGGVDAMMSGCFVSGGADAPAFHDASFGFPSPADVAGGTFFVDGGGSMLAAGQLQLIRAAAPPPSMSPEQTRGACYGVGGGYGPSPSDDVTVAHAPYHCSSTWFFSGDGGGFRDPFAAAAASDLSLRLPAPPESAFSLPAGALNVSLTDQSSSEVSCSGLTHASSSVAAAAGVFRPSSGGGGGGEMAARPPGPLHFSQVLSRWPGYSHITQETLDEFVGCLLQDVAGFAGGEASCPLPMSSCSNTTSSDPSVFLGSEEHAHHKLKNDLQKLLQLLDQGCNQWMDEIQSAACKYGGMVRPGTGVLLAAFANRAVSAMHRRLRARITGEIAAAAAASRRRGSPSPAVTLADRERSWESAFIQKHWALRQLRRGDQQSWRPQRGLPEKSVAVLKAWMFENFLRPYPKDNEKEMLAVRSGLSRSQVSNWFINARVRLWKPMIEEMYEDLKKASGGGDGVVA
nr:unnamed protein product [Digitaria exilis]